MAGHSLREGQEITPSTVGLCSLVYSDGAKLFNVGYWDAEEKRGRNLTMRTFL